MLYEVITRFRRRRIARAGADVEGGAHRSGAAMAEREQRLLAPAEERPLEHRREQQIVARQQRRLGGGEQVLHRHVSGEVEAVRARDADAARLQRPDQVGLEGIALSYNFV